MGNQHHRTADVCHKVAQHCLRRHDYQNALLLVDQALKAWNVDKKAYLPEISRTTFLKAKTLLGLHNEQQARVMFKKAATWLTTLQPKEKREDRDLVEGDFDALVTFWSK